LQLPVPNLLTHNDPRQVMLKLWYYSSPFVDQSSPITSSYVKTAVRNVTFPIINILFHSGDIHDQRTDQCCPLNVTEKTHTF